MLTPSTTTIDLNVGYPNILTVAHAVQGDNQSRILTAHLYDNGVAWNPPAGSIGVIKFRTPLGTSGMYDTDEEGNTAVTWEGNVATLRIVQNALAVAGDVPMQLSFYDGNGAVLTTFLWETLVQPSVLTDTQFMQTDYYNILSQQIAAILTAVADIPEPSTTTPKMDGTAAVGTENTFARGDHVHPSDTSRVPTTRTINGMDLSANRTLTAENIGYDETLASHTADSVGEELSELRGALTNKMFIKSGTISSAHTSAATTTLATDTAKINASTDIANVWFSNPSLITSDYTVATNANGQVTINCTNSAQVTVYVVLFNP